MLLNSGLKVKIFDDLYYGGPSALSQYKAFITLSYQVSTMKIYENLAEGVVTYVPTVRFLKELVETKEFEYPFIRETFWDGENWFKNIEYYHDDITSYIYKFDSMEELKEKMEKENVDPLNVREKSKIFWREERIKSLKRWSNVLEIPIPTS
ncbi:hypothetical protein HDU92_000705 [Lobulomyces angularis]|nr:hypothetical protein HDU92_000705 [Lobulomyces angularis]